MSKGVAQPMDPMYLINFMSNRQINAKLVACFMAAVKKYHKAITAAAKTLDEDLNACMKPAMPLRKPLPVIKKPVITKTKATTRKKK